MTIVLRAVFPWLLGWATYGALALQVGVESPWLWLAPLVVVLGYVAIWP